MTECVRVWGCVLSPVTVLWPSLKLCHHWLIWNTNSQSEIRLWARSVNPTENIWTQTAHSWCGAGSELLDQMLMMCSFSSWIKVRWKGRGQSCCYPDNHHIRTRTPKLQESGCPDTRRRADRRCVKHSALLQTLFTLDQRTLVTPPRPRVMSQLWLLPLTSLRKSDRFWGRSFSSQSARISSK